MITHLKVPFVVSNCNFIYIYIYIYIYILMTPQHKNYISYWVSDNGMCQTMVCVGQWYVRQWYVSDNGVCQTMVCVRQRYVSDNGMCQTKVK